MPKAIDAPTLKQWLDDDQAVVIDVREPDEYRAGHITGSILLPVGGIMASQLPALNGKKLVVQCRSGKRSEMACHKIVADNPALEPINLTGGILGWIEAGYETVT
jgi:hypothetical protein